MSIVNEVEEIVREMGRVTALEVIQLMPHVSRQQVYSRLSSLEAQGKISSEKIPDPKDDHRKVNCYSFGGTPKPVAARARKVPTNQAQMVNAADYRAKIAELEKWKADAIARYPDLGVDPDVLAARKIVHRMVKEGGDKHMADQIIAGHKDEALMMRAVIAALAERN